MALISKLIHKEDPAAIIWREIGDGIEGFDIAAQGVLVATYKREADVMSAGGVLYPHAAVKDDEFQSKTGLVVKLGRRAFIDDEHIQWNGFRCDVGDWVIFRASDGIRMSLGGPGGAHCRLMADVYLKIKVPNADAVF
jgi:co-chaperonin GroES (HSP10)